MLTRLKLFQNARSLDVLRYWRSNGDLNLNAPYQRGDVWSDVRRRNLIRSVLRGVPIPSIVTNDRDTAGWGTEGCVVIDGKQRITALLRFLDGELGIPEEWIRHGAKDRLVTFDTMTLPEQRHFKQATLSFSEGLLGSLEEEREVFDLVNFGGVPQGETD